jgi:peptide-methionine (S)-S-oxide reductase
MKNNIILISIILLLQACYGKERNTQNYSNKSQSESEALNQNIKRAYFASGCFWCVEAIYESIIGVKEVYSGYSGGITLNPTYNSIGTGETGHAEAVEVIYDTSIVSFETLVNVFFGSHDPTTLNSQGPDRGTQYRSIAFYQTDEEKKIIENHIKQLTENKVFKRKIVTEVKELEKFFIAENYHQNYERLNPNNSYVRNVSIPRLKRFKAKFPDLLKVKN